MARYFCIDLDPHRVFRVKCTKGRCWKRSSASIIYLQSEIRGGPPQETQPLQDLRFRVSLAADTFFMCGHAHRVTRLWPEDDKFLQKNCFGHLYIRWSHDVVKIKNVFSRCYFSDCCTFKALLLFLMFTSLGVLDGLRVPCHVVVELGTLGDVRGLVAAGGTDGARG